LLVTNHVLAGAAIGVLARRRPALAFAAGVASHALLDICPHWGISLDSEENERRFLRVAKCDGTCGLTAMAVAAAAAGPGARKGVMAAMAGSVLPDLDKPAKHFLGFDPFPKSIQRFHANIQDESPRRMPQEIVVAAVGALLLGALLRRTR